MIARAAFGLRKSFRQFFFREVGLISGLHDYSEDLDNVLWAMGTHRDEMVLQFSLKEYIRLFIELPQGTEEVPEV